MCTVLKLTRSSFYKWKATQARRASRICADGVLGARIAAVFAEEDGLYGAKRITASLNDDERFARVNHKKVVRFMKNMKLRGFSKRRRCVTTQRSTSTPVFEDLVKRRFHAQAPNQVYVGDITYMPCRNGSNIYLATVIDLYSRKLAGFAIADHMRSSLVIEALDHANTVRGGLDGAIFHSDHGSVYTSAAFSTRCQELRVIQSMGAIGTSADNASAESFNSTMKREVLRNRKVFANPLQCRQEVLRWCIRYNTQRRHSWCGQISPDLFEAQSITLTKAA